MQLPLVAVGIGNTSIRFGVASAFVDGRPRWNQWIESATADFDPQKLAGQLPQQVTVWRSASVHRPTERRLREWLYAAFPESDYRELKHHDLDLDIQVEAPDRVGMDRLVAVVAANQLRQPGVPAIVIDAGTAITVDRVSEEGGFQGGAILPGLRLVAQALATNTDLLPLVDGEFLQPPDALGRSTESAIRSGLFWGSVGAVCELVERLRPNSTQPTQVFVTGGDAARLVACLRESLGSTEISHEPDLVMMGIAMASGNL